MNTDPIADYLTRIRNGLKARHVKVSMPSSHTKVRLSKLLSEEGYISGYRVEKCVPQEQLHLTLKYDFRNKRPTIDRLTRISRPGLRKYTKSINLPHIRNGLGVAVISTSKGLLTDKKARAQGIGGEVLCTVE